MVVYVDVFSLSHPDTGTSLGTAWIAQDVTDLRSTEAALREANSDLKQFKALVEASPDFIAIANPDGNVKYVNPGGRHMLEMDPDVDPTTTSIPEYVTPEVFALYPAIRLQQDETLTQPMAVEVTGEGEAAQTTIRFRGPEMRDTYVFHEPSLNAFLSMGRVLEVAMLQRVHVHHGAAAGAVVLALFVPLIISSGGNLFWPEDVSSVLCRYVIPSSGFLMFNNGLRPALAYKSSFH